MLTPSLDALPPGLLPPTPKSPSTVSSLAQISVATSSAVRPLPPLAGPSTSTITLVPPVLTFSLSEAKSHLSVYDPRFAPLFLRTGGPFEDLKPVDTFRSLVTSLLGQQIAWQAARSITHRFIRLFYPDDLPEKHDPATAESYKAHFPTPRQILSIQGDQVATLKSVGLSTRKAEYVLALADKFEKQELSVERLMESSDEDVREMLVACRGIGPWTADMFEMFSLHRPDILPWFVPSFLLDCWSLDGLTSRPCSVLDLFSGDLGVQKGLLKWVIGMYDPQTPHPSTSTTVLAAPPTPHPTPLSTSSTAGRSAFPPPFEQRATSPSLPLPFSSVGMPATSLPAGSTSRAWQPPPLPDGITLDLLKSRLAGKKAKGGVYLTREEMERLTDGWRPYRSLGSWWMWKVAEEGFLGV